MSGKSIIQQHIGAGEITEALEVFSALANAGYPRLSNDLLLISSRWNALRRQVNQGIIAESSAKMETARISHALIELLEKVPNDVAEPVLANVPQPPTPGPAPAPATARKKILFLASNPRDTARLRLGEEVRDIEQQLRLANKRDAFEFVSQLAVRTTDLVDQINWVQPNIVHFAGHGEGSEGLVFEDSGGNAKVVSTEALANLFELFSDCVECVVLNACYSETQADAILQHIPYVVGMSSAVPDGVAVRFASAFYGGLASGKGIEFAFKLARVAVQVDGLSGSEIPVLKKKQV